MKTPYDGHRQDEHHYIREDIGETDPPEKAIDIDTMAARNGLVPIVGYRRATKGSCEPAGDEVCDDYYAEDVAYPTIQLDGEDAQVYGQDAELWQSCGEEVGPFYGQE